MSHTNASNSQRIIDLEEEVAQMREKLRDLDRLLKLNPGLTPLTRIVIKHSEASTWAFADYNGTVWAARSASAQVSAPVAMSGNGVQLAVFDRGRWVLIPKGTSFGWIEGELVNDVDSSSPLTGRLVKITDFNYEVGGDTFDEEVFADNPMKFYGPAGTKVICIRREQRTVGGPINSTRNWYVIIGMPCTDTEEGESELTIEDFEFPVMNQGTPITPFYVLAGGGTPPYTFSVLSGDMPPDIDLETDGEVTAGPPMTVDSGSVVVRVTDATSATADTSSIPWAVLPPEA